MSVLRKIEEAHRSGATTLDLSNNELTSLPPQVIELTALRRLRLSGNQLKSLPPEISKLTVLTRLDLDSNQLSSLPPEIGELTALTELNLDDNQFTAFPPGIAKLTALTSLSLGDNQLTSLPAEITWLTALRWLKLSGNQLTSLPPGITELRALSGLPLNRNELTSLPPEIVKLTTLTWLSLSSNQLTSLPPEIGKLTALTDLYVSDNRLTSLPPEVGKLTALTGLHLGGNRLTELPPEIAELSALTSLDLDDNQLTGVPPEIARLSNLEWLQIGFNQLTSLPQEVTQLTALKSLSFRNNKLTSLPSEITRLTAVTKLDLAGNTALNIPEELLDSPSDPKAILDFYFALKAEGQEPLQEVRLLLVGRGRVGKTSLLKAMCGVAPDRDEEETPGISVEPLPLECPRGDVSAHVWDFGGQEFLHGTHQIFLAERCVYLLVLEGRESNWESESAYWIRFIQSFGGDSRVIVVLTKFDEHPFSVDQHRLKERCPQIVDFVETDAFTGLGIEELRALLSETVNDMDDVWEGVPRSWHRVKKKLTTHSQNFLSYDEYLKLCSGEGVAEGHDESLCRTLHQLGIALNFREHARLRDTSVLKPQWVTTAIYSVLRDVQKRQSNGVLQVEWLKDALDSEDYPPETHRFILSLMEKFEVAFLMANEREWLIPELLSETQPDAFAEFRGPGVRRVRYEYPQALPPGLLPRLIVRTHAMSAGDELDSPGSEKRWRTGVVLRWDEASALVRLDRQERRVEVAVIENTPDDDDRQSLFDLVRAHITVLTGKVRVIEETEMDGHPDSWIPMQKLRGLEERGRKETEEVTVDGDLATVAIPETLDRVESRSSRIAKSEEAPAQMRLFVSYSHEDRKQIGNLSRHLTVLGAQGYIQAWDDTQLIAGEEWKERILEELGRADVVLLICSTNSRASTFIRTIEAPEALRRARDENDSCIPVVVPLDRNDWDESDALERDLSRHQAATWEGEPVLDFKPQRKGWQEVERSIKRVVQKLREERGPERELNLRKHRGG